MMKKSAVGPLIGLIYELYEGKIPDGVQCPSETDLVFVVRTDVGPLGFEIQCYRDAEGWKTVSLSVSPMILVNGEALELYDLCKIDRVEYELMDKLRGLLEWTSLYLSSEEGSKYPVLTRSEILDPTLTFKDQNLTRIISVIQMMELDAVAVTPILAAISSGTHLDLDDVSLAMSDVHSSVQ